MQVCAQASAKIEIAYNFPNTASNVMISLSVSPYNGVEIYSIMPFPASYANE